MITVVITVGDLPPERRAPVLAALHENLANSLVRDIQVLTEAPPGEHMAWLLQAAGAAVGRLHLTHVLARPTFAEIFRVANALLTTGAETVAVMNADISIASEADAARMMSALDILNAREEPVVLALARHETDGRATPELALYESNGLPNTLSADCWTFQRPLHVERDLFYALGQMNCDMLLAHDLVSTNHRLYNPCLDIVLNHHEPEKDTLFYQEKNQEISSQEILYQHATINQVIPWNYYGTPWVRTEWLRLKYRPAANSTHGRRLLLAVFPGSEERLSDILLQLAKVIARYDFEAQILCENFDQADQIVTEHATALAAEPRIWIAATRHGIAATLHALLAGNQSSFTRLAFLQDLSRLDEAVLRAADGFVVTLHKQPFCAPTSFGCTLITSVFRSDLFIRGFLRNMGLLQGYDRLIEHIFLVSTLSEIEVDALCRHMATHPYVVILWHRKDPGLYECWNIGIRLARTDYVSNANVDDLRDPRHVITLMRHLEMRPEVAVAATALVPFHEFPVDGTPPLASEVWYADQAGRFSFLDLARPIDPAAPRLDPHNMPHCMPVWRRTLHNRYGWFDEAGFGTYADWAFWLKVLEDGGSGWLAPEPLSFYFVNPTSHNRRGANLEERHRAVEEAFLDTFLARTLGRLSSHRGLHLDTQRKLNLWGRDLHYGRHRNAFSKLIEALEPLNSGLGGVRFIPFLERQFVWGDAEDEAASQQPRPITENWIGMLHVPFNAPPWFEDLVRPETFFATQLFQESLPACRGIITLCADLERDLKNYFPGMPTLAVRHPTDFNVRMFDFNAYCAHPKVLQVGDWLRKLQAIHLLCAPQHQRIMLLKQHTKHFMEREIAVFGDHRDPGVEMRNLVPNDEYDALLASSVILCLMYATAANNVVIECIARATPIIINPLPAVVEYLGEEYPLYVRDVVEADKLLATPKKVQEAHCYLLRRRTEIDLTYEGFCRGLAESVLYANL